MPDNNFTPSFEHVARMYVTGDPSNFPYDEGTWQFDRFQEFKRFVDRVGAAAILNFVDEYSKIHKGVMENLDDAAPPEYWRGGNDASDYLEQRLRSHANFLIHGHGD